jgi:hypothetical protein
VTVVVMSKSVHGRREITSIVRSRVTVFLAAGDGGNVTATLGCTHIYQLDAIQISVSNAKKRTCMVGVGATAFGFASPLRRRMRRDLLSKLVSTACE